jgi:hypothetical protein
MVRDIHGMVMVGASFPDAKAQVAAEVTCEPRMLLKTFRDEGRAGLSSSLIRRGSRASAEDRTRPKLQVADYADLP